MFSLILGGNKSGKSSLALELAGQEDQPPLLVVTGKARDFEFQRQIFLHKQDRDREVTVVESGPDLGRCLESMTISPRPLVIDSIDFWVFTVYNRQEPQSYIENFFKAVSSRKGQRFIFVSCEVGLGPLPADKSTRNFVRMLGSLNQRLARECDEVMLVAAGLPVKIK
ncbi:MAG: bifunctional adenosylcobinamide kinase/adenosylcobinamide-phosphate guanylyltransferase [Desulfonatronovibrionaceae bacterium]